MVNSIQMEPLIFSKMFLFAYGLNTWKPNKKISVITWMLGIHFHFICTCSSTILFCCFVRFRTNFSALGIFTSGITFAIWWAVYVKSRQLLRLQSCLKNLRKIYTFEGRRNPLWTFNMLSCIVIFLMCIIPSTSSAIFIYNSDNRSARCNECWFHLPTMELKAAYTFVLQMVRQLVNWGLAYSVSVLYSSICLELNMAAGKMLHEVSFQNASTYNRVLEFYRLLIGAVTKLEDGMSLAILLVFCNCFNELFRALTHCIFHFKTKASPHLLVLAAFYFAGSSVTVLSVICCADNLQRKCALLRKAILDTSEELSGYHELAELLKEDLLLLEDKDNIQLTAWGMFEVKKGIVITALASLISYSVILGQLKF